MGKKNAPTKDHRQELEEASSRARHPTAKRSGGNGSTDDGSLEGRPFEVEVCEIWAAALTDDALFQHFARYLAEPKGWKKRQKDALLGEVGRRVAYFHMFKDEAREAVREFRQALNQRLNGDVAALNCAQRVERAVDRWYPFATDRDQSQDHVGM